MPRRLVLSAHLDDAVFSCWAALARRDTDTVTVATVFAACPPRGFPTPPWDQASAAVDSQAQVRMRQKEDVAALGRAEAALVHLDFLDEQYRVGSPQKTAIAEALEELGGGYDEVWIPAAIGGHVDHRLVCEAALASTLELHRVLYADLPYTAVYGWPLLVAAARAGFHVSCSLEAQLASSSFIPPQAVPRLHQLSPVEQEAKLRAIGLYQSQLGPLERAFGRWFEDPKLRDVELFWELGP